MAPILTVTLNPTVDISGETDVIWPIRKVRTDHDRFEPGGGGINVARVIHTLDGEAEALFLSGGEIGALLDRLLANRRIHRHRITVGGQTRIGFNARERSTGLEYRFVQEGPSVHIENLQPVLDVVAGHQGSYVVCSGSLPHGAPDDTYARMAELTAARNACFVLDSSGTALRTTLERARVHLVKPSIGELEQLAGTTLDQRGAERAAAELVERGSADIVAVTLGADGAILATAEGVEHFPAIHVRVRSAVGAGDAFLAAMTLALSRGWLAGEAFRLGLAAGAAAAMTPGSELCHRKEVFALYAAAGGTMPVPEAG